MPRPPGLPKTHIVERLVQLPLEHPEHVQSGFAMPDQDQCGTHDTSTLSFGAWSMSSATASRSLPQPLPGVADEMAMAGTSSNDTLLADTSTSPALGLFRHIPRTGS